MELPLKTRQPRFSYTTALAISSKGTVGLELLCGSTISTRMHNSTGNLFTNTKSSLAHQKSTVFGTTWTSPLCSVLSSKRYPSSLNILNKMGPRFFTETSTMHTGLWCTGPHTRVCSPGMTTSAELLYWQEAFSMAVKSTELTGRVITKPRS